MPLTDLQKERIEKFIPTFKNYLTASDRIDDIQARQERTTLYLDLLSLKGIRSMDELSFGRVISSLWSFAMWGNKGFLVEKLLEDNPLDELKIKLKELLWSNDPLADRYDSFLNNCRGFGPATISELLAFTHPETCGLWNKIVRDALTILGFRSTFPIIGMYQITGTQYIEINNLLSEIRQELSQYDLGDLDLLGIDYFLYEVVETGVEVQDMVGDITVDEGNVKIEDFNHNEIIDQLLSIGQWLGFNVEKEKTIAPGSRVDAVWQTGVGNLGVVTYVFEVQRRGSRDSLILNLQRALNNPTVQRLVVVALKDELSSIKSEIESLPENFRRKVGYIDVIEVMRATDLVTELSGIINKLELVKSEFDNVN